MKENELIRKIEYALAFIVMLYAAFLFYRIISAVIISVPYPNEYREAANIAMTRSILSGENIYSLKAQEGVAPSVCYLYGSLMSVLAAGLSRIFPACSLQAIHYGISVFSILASCVMMGFMVYRHTKSPVSCALGFTMMIFCHWRYGYGYGAPDSFGLCLMTAVLFLLLAGVRREASGRKGIDFYIEGAALLTLATFFTKQYFLVVAGVGAVYLFIISKRLFFRYAASGIVFSIITFSALRSKCPLYLTYALYFLKGPGPGAAMGKTGISHNVMQISYLGGMLLALFICVFVYLMEKLYRFAVECKKEGHLCKIKYDPFVTLFMTQAAVSALLLRYIGNNDGAFLSYYLQLFTPALVALSVFALDSFGERLKSGKRVGWIFILLCVIFFGYTVYKTEPRLILGTLDEEEMAEWQRAYEVLDGYRDGEIYYSALLAFNGYAHGDYVYDDGQQFVFTPKFLKSYNESSVAQKLFPHAGEVIEKHLSYREIMKEKQRAGEYSLIMRLEDRDEVFDLEELKVNYRLLDTYTLRAGSWSWNVEYWVRRQEG